MSKYKDLVCNDTLRTLKDKLNENNNSVENDIKNLQTQITTNENDIEAKHKTHLESTKAHKAEHITYTGNVAGQSNVKSAIDNVQSQVKSIVVGGTNSDARVSQALVDSESTTHTTLKDRNDKWESRVKEIEYQTKEAKHTDELTQESNIFGIGKGKNALGQDVDVSSSVVNGQVSDVKLEGTTHTNLLGNLGDCETLTGWTNPNITPGSTVTVDSSTKLFGNSSFKYVCEGGNAHRYVDIKNLKADSYYELSGYVSIERFTSGAFRIYAYEYGSFTTLIRGATADSENLYKWQRLRVKFTGKDAVRVSLGNGSTTTGVAYYDGIMLNEITKEEYEDVNSVSSNFINCTKSTVSATRIKTIGKNLFNMHGDINYYPDKNYNPRRNYLDGDEIVLDSFTAIQASRGARHQLEPNTQYIFSADVKNKLVSVVITDLTTEFVFANRIHHRIKVVDFTVGNGRAVTFITPPSGKIFISMGTAGEVGTPARISNVQLEKGNPMTAYEPYKESITYVSAKDETGKIIELHSFLNGVKDELSITDKKLIKRSKSRIIQSSDVYSMVTKYAELDYAQILKPVDYVTYDAYMPRNNAILSGYTEVNYINHDINDIKNIGKFNAGAHTTAIWVGFPKGTTLTQARSDLVGSKLTYQLTIPIEYNLDVGGSLESFPNGTMYIDPYIADNFQYGDTGITLPYPVSAIDKVETIVNGKLEEINLATVTLNTTDYITITITGASKGKAYNVYAPIKQEESTRGTVKYKAPLNTSATLMDTNALSNRNKKDIDYVKDLTNAHIIQTEFELALTKARLDTIETKINTKP